MHTYCVVLSHSYILELKDRKSLEIKLDEFFSECIKYILFNYQKVHEFSDVSAGSLKFRNRVIIRAFMRRQFT